MSTTVERPADGGPPVDPDSPFTETHAREVRRAAQRSSARGLVRKTFSWLLAAAIVVLAVFAGSRLIGYRLAAADRLSLGTATLTASQVSVPAPGDGQVIGLDVQPAQRVAAGAQLALLKVFGTDSTGHVTSSRMKLVAPVSGIVSAVETPAGSAVQRGAAVVQMYEPRQETFHATVDTSTLGRLRRGMHATMTGAAVPGSIPAVVDHVLAPLQAPADGNGVGGQTGDASNQITVVLRPLHPRDVSGLAPGLQFDAVVNTATAPRHAPRVARVVGP